MSMIQNNLVSIGCETPKFEMLVEKAWNVNPALGVLVAIFDVATIGVFELINQAYFLCSTANQTPSLKNREIEMIRA